MRDAATFLESCELDRYHFCFVRVTGAHGQYQGEISACLRLRQSHDLKQLGITFPKHLDLWLWRG
jgi:hypothetical protein